MICLAKCELTLPASWLKRDYRPRSHATHSEYGQF